MKLVDAIEIDAAVTDVWPLVADPARHPQWNEKARAVTRDRSGPVSLGEQFEMTYAMSGRENISRVEVTDLQPSERAEFSHTIDDGRRVQRVVERYELQSQRDGTQLTQTVDMSGAGIPWLLKPLVWLITRIGKPQGETVLERLKRIAELDRR